MSNEPGSSARFLDTLERLLALPAADLATTLADTCDLAASATGADKVDAFLYDPRRDSLVAVGSSHQPLSVKQRQLGLDVLPLSNGGRVAWVYTTGRTFVTGRLDEDHEELRGVKEGLKIVSKLGVPIVAGGTRRGMMMLASLRRDFFTDEDVRFAEAVGGWTAEVMHRAELVEEITRNAAEHGRRAAAEELFTVLAHDMRNLISPLGVLLHGMQMRTPGADPQKDAADLDVAQRALARLRSLVSDLLDVARIDAGLFHGIFEPVDLAALVRDAAETLAVTQHPVDVRVSADSALMVRGDAARLRQCLDNVILNAIQNSPKHAPVSVVVSTQRREDGEWLRVDVIDEGPGVPPDAVPHLFERYVTGRPERGGLGLGLYLAREIAVMHGGELTVDRARRTGARFVLALPAIAAR